MSMRGMKTSRGRLSKIHDFTDANALRDDTHGTAVTSIIGARTNNARGIAGIAPDAELEIFVSCWRDASRENPVCDSFSLAKALDRMLERPPHVANLSLTGPHDPLLERLIGRLLAEDVVVVAARPNEGTGNLAFPADMQGVIAVGSIMAGSEGEPQQLYAPGMGIMVALPGDSYDLRSGNSMAAAHVSGTAALILAVAPHLTRVEVQQFLQRSQDARIASVTSINACIALHLANPDKVCLSGVVADTESELQPDP